MVLDLHFKLHQSHAFRKEAITDVALPFTQQFAWPLFLALVLATLGLALSRKLRRSDAILLLAAASGEIAALVGFATQWADSNAFIPAIFFPAFAAAVLAARLLDVVLAGRKWGAMIMAAGVALLLGSQSLHTTPPTPVRGRVKPPILIGWPRPSRSLPTLASAVPSAQDRVAAGVCSTSCARCPSRCSFRSTRTTPCLSASNRRSPHGRARC